MDGNRTWARQRNVERTVAYERGARVCHEIVRATFDLGIEVASFYVLSRQNVDARPSREIERVLEIFVRYLSELVEEVAPIYECSVLVLGDLDPLPAEIRAQISVAMERTRRWKKRVVCFCVNFDGRDEIVRFIRGNPGSSRDLLLSSPSGLPDLDLIIRTAGGNRLSSFMLWEANYAEIVALPETWPDFTPEKLAKTIGSLGPMTKFGA